MAYILNWVVNIRTLHEAHWVDRNEKCTPALFSYKPMKMLGLVQVFFELAQGKIMISFRI